MQFDCATTEVPADYAQPDAATLELALVRAVSTAPDRDRIGSLVVNPGGPGASGIDAAVMQAATAPDALVDAFDLVGFDPRGVGLSTPLDCLSDTDQDDSLAADPTPDEVEFAEAADLAEATADTCASAYEDQLGLLNTEYTARDLDRIRAGLEEEQLTYLGYSYGTTLGSTYAELFPDRVRALVLDGATDPSLDRIESAYAQAGGFEVAFDRFADACGQAGPACPAGPDPRGLLTDLLAAAETTPLSQSTGDPRPVGEGLIVNGVAGALYDEQTWPVLAEALAGAAAGDGAAIAALSDTFAMRGPDGTYSGNIPEMNSAVNCADTAEQIDPDAVIDLAQEWGMEFPYFGSFIALGLLTCAYWDAERHPLPERDAAGAAPILVIGTEGDPATPYEGAEHLAEQLDSGVLLTWEGEGHTAFPKTECITEAVLAYLIEQEVPEDGTTCAAS